MAVGAGTYRQMLSSLAPPGQALPDALDSQWQLLLRALAETLAAVDQRMDDLVREADPQTTRELLADWERVTGLPDDCVEGEQTQQARREAVVDRLRERRTITPAYLEEVIAGLGYDGEIVERRHRRHGDRHSRRYGGWDWSATWEAHLPAVTVRERRHGQAAMGEPYRRWGYDDLECLLRRLNPAHTLVRFIYGEA